MDRLQTNVCVGHMSVVPDSSHQMGTGVLPLTYHAYTSWYKVELRTKFQVYIAEMYTVKIEPFDLEYFGSGWLGA